MARCKGGVWRSGTYCRRNWQMVNIPVSELAEGLADLAYILLLRIILPGCDVDYVFSRSQDEQCLEPAAAHWPLLLGEKSMASIIVSLDAHMGTAFLRGGFTSSGDKDTALVDNLAVLHIVEDEHCLGLQ